VNVKDPNAKSREHARQTFWVSQLLNQRSKRSKLSPEDIHARLIFLIGATLALTFFCVTVGTVYALIFVTQPIGAQAPNDAAFIDLLKTLAIFLTGSLGGVLAGNGLKSRKKENDTPNDTRNV
jgi:hypothetical protein